MIRLLSITLALAGLILFKGISYGCACGCSVFDVGSGAMFPTEPGMTFSLDYDYMDQNQNWSGTAAASADNNPDKELRTSFYTLSGRYMFNKAWGISVDVPVWERFFTTTDDNGNAVSYDHTALGDIKARFIYTGLNEEMTSGLIAGIKLPTGDNTYVGFDPDTQIGTGSTDLLLGFYHVGQIVRGLNWIINGEYDQPIISSASYSPGRTFDGSLGIIYNNWMIGDFMIAPMLDLVVSYRDQDSGYLADPDSTGYTRLFLSPGLEFDFDGWKLNVAVDIPVYQDFNGNQLAASFLTKAGISFSF